MARLYKSAWRLFALAGPAVLGSLKADPRSKAEALASLAGPGPALPSIVVQLWLLTLGPPWASRASQGNQGRRGADVWAQRVRHRPL